MAIISLVTFLLGLCLSWADPRSEVDLDGGKPRGRPGPSWVLAMIWFSSLFPDGVLPGPVSSSGGGRGAPLPGEGLRFSALCIAAPLPSSPITVGLSQATQAWNLPSIGREARAEGGNGGKDGACSHVHPALQDGAGQRQLPHKGEQLQN